MRLTERFQRLRALMLKNAAPAYSDAGQAERMLADGLCELAGACERPTEHTVTIDASAFEAELARHFGHAEQLAQAMNDAITNLQARVAELESKLAGAIPNVSDPPGGMIERPEPGA